MATDLDGTFAAGTADQRRRLQRAIADASATLFYVTGRTVEATRRIMAEAHLPGPHLLIGDVGTTVVKGEDFTPLPVEEALQQCWPGHEAVRGPLQALPELVEQPINAPRRVSYTLLPDTGYTLDQALDRARERLQGVGVDVLGSAGVYLDVLPAGVNKGTTLSRVLRWLGRDAADVVVAGDSLNDLGLFQTGMNGVETHDAE
ncbi:MAG: HAD-IIB family hydrolase [Gemmatimonadota bacterium]